MNGKSSQISFTWNCYSSLGLLNYMHINVHLYVLLLNEGNSIFCWQIHNGTFQRIFRGPGELSREMPLSVVYFAQTKKNIFTIFIMSRTLVILCISATVCPNFFPFKDVYSFFESLEENLCWKCPKNIEKSAKA